MPSCAGVPTEFHHRLLCFPIDVFYSNFGNFLIARHMSAGPYTGQPLYLFRADNALRHFKPGGACSWPGMSGGIGFNQVRLLLPCRRKCFPSAREFGSKCTEEDSVLPNGLRCPP